MIPGDLGAQIAAALRAAVASGEIAVAGAAAITAAGTWRPAPESAGGGAGTYATSLPFALAGLIGTRAEPIAALLAARLGAVPWISSARVTGGGYLTVTVAVGCLAGLAARMAAAGPDRAVGSAALTGLRLRAPALPDLAAARSWQRAWLGRRDALSGRLARAAGAEVVVADSERTSAAGSAIPADSGPVAAALAYHGADAVGYVLARTATCDARAIDRQLCVPLDLDNPFVAVRYAHAEAAAVLRRAGELWRAAGDITGQPASAAASGVREERLWRPLPPELTVLDALSWLPERVAAAARRRRPAELASWLEHIAASWLDCVRSCPALPFGGRAAPSSPSGYLAVARCGLADAVRVALAAGLGLLGVTAPLRA